MKEDILLLEKDFANNEYFGTNVWTEEKYRVLSGKLPVMVSAPHSVNQFREEDIRPAEKYTGALARYLSYKIGAYSIFQLFTHADANNEENSLYRNGIINLVNVYNIKLLIDIHSSTFSDDADIDIVSNNRETLLGDETIIKKLMFLGNIYGLKIAENNFPNKNKAYEVIGSTSLLCKIPCIRIVLNNKSFDFENNSEKACKIADLLIDFINSYR